MRKITLMSGTDGLVAYGVRKTAYGGYYNSVCTQSHTHMYLHILHTHAHITILPEWDVHPKLFLFLEKCIYRNLS